ncbi:MAG TPA: cytochrome c [Gammaproteobacteria bacterium]|nr:cytochrome c [Gammaproteobacteria bacterium]
MKTVQMAMTLRVGEWIVLGGSVLIVAFSVVVGYIIYKKPPPVEYIYLASDETLAGERIYHQASCPSCHEVFGVGTSFGPALDGIGSRRTAGWLEAYLRAPRAGVSAKRYRLRMPPYEGTDTELNQLVKYLLALRKQGSTPAATAVLDEQLGE